MTMKPGDIKRAIIITGDLTEVDAFIFGWGVLDSIKEFYKDPENMRKFKEWEKQQDATKKETVTTDAGTSTDCLCYSKHHTNNA